MTRQHTPRHLMQSMTRKAGPSPEEHTLKVFTHCGATFTGVQQILAPETSTLPSDSFTKTPDRTTCKACKRSYQAHRQR